MSGGSGDGTDSETAQDVVMCSVAQFEQIYGYFQIAPPRSIHERAKPPPPTAFTIPACNFPLSQMADDMKAAAATWLSQAGLLYTDYDTNLALFSGLVQLLVNTNIDQGIIYSTNCIVTEYQDDTITIQALCAMAGGSNLEADSASDNPFFMSICMLEQVVNTQPSQETSDPGSSVTSEGGDHAGPGSGRYVVVSCPTPSSLRAAADEDPRQVAISAFTPPLMPFAFNGPYGAYQLRARVQPAQLSCEVQVLPPTNPGDLGVIQRTAVDWLCQQDLFYGGNRVLTTKLFSSVLAEMAMGLTQQTPVSSAGQQVTESGSEQVVAQTVAAGVLDSTDSSPYTLRFALAIVETTPLHLHGALPHAAASKPRWPTAPARRRGARTSAASPTTAEPKGYSLVNFIPTRVLYLHSDALSSVTGSPAFGLQSFTNHCRVVQMDNRYMPIQSVVALGSLYNSVDPLTLLYTQAAYLPPAGSVVYLRLVPEPQDTEDTDPCKYIAAFLSTQPDAIVHLWGRGLPHQANSQQSTARVTSPSSSSSSSSSSAVTLQSCRKSVGRK